MLNLLNFLKEFGTVINTALILSLIGIAFKIFKATIKQKEAELNVLKERIKNHEAFAVDNVTAKFKALKEYYEEHLKDWYEASLKSLEEEKNKAIEGKEKIFQERIEVEIEKRKSLMFQYSTDRIEESVLNISADNVCGSYFVAGHNPTQSDKTYIGELRIEKTGESLKATWEIASYKQKHVGTGILVGNSIAIVYVSDMSPFGVDKPQTGVVLYEYLTSKVMRGNWTAVGSTSLGFEECRKMDESEELKTTINQNRNRKAFWSDPRH